jgi:2-dehydropantoate 2-reductase
LRTGIYHGHKGDCLTTEGLLADPEWFAIVRELMDEVISAAHAHGFSIPQEFAEEQIERTLNMGPYKPSTLVDYLLDREIELDSLFLEPLRRAQAKGVPTPRLAALCAILTHVARDLSV